MITKKIKMIRTPNKSQHLEFLLMKVYLLFLEDLIFHQMENYLFYQQEYGKNQSKADQNIAHFFIVKISLRSLLFAYQPMENQPLFASFALCSLEKKIQKQGFS